MARSIPRITTLLACSILAVTVHALIGANSNLMALERGKDAESKRGNKPNPNVLAGFSEKQVFVLKQGGKYSLYRFKSYLEVTAVIYLMDKDKVGNTVWRARRLADSARGRQYFRDTPMVQVDYCATQFHSFEDARQAALEGKIAWIEDLIRPPSAFKGNIKSIGKPHDPVLRLRNQKEE